MTNLDPALATDHVLHPDERTIFTNHIRAIGRDGMEPADYLDEADDTDAYCGPIDDRWEAADGDQAVAVLAGQTRLPRSLCRRLLADAVAACIVLGLVDPGNIGPAAAPLDLATRAAWWARGYTDREQS